MKNIKRHRKCPYSRKVYFTFINCMCALITKRKQKTKKHLINVSLTKKGQCKIGTSQIVFENNS